MFPYLLSSLAMLVLKLLWGGDVLDFFSFSFSFAKCMHLIFIIKFQYASEWINIVSRNMSVRIWSHLFLLIPNNLAQKNNMTKGI